MFRKKRNASQHRPQLSTSSTQSAQSAATRAFLKSQASSNSLSSAAAAAALRSLTPTPTPVENVQTKRMLQRHASISSTSGSPIFRPSSRNGLRRVNSSGSMSARTFRDQSPSRPTSSYSTSGVAPPLPSIPPEYTALKAQNRRSVSLGPNVAKSDNVQSVPSRKVGTVSPEHQRSESRNSINFSYPMNSRTNSPTIPPAFPHRRDAAIGAIQNDHKVPEDASRKRRSVAQPAKGSQKQTQGAGPALPGSPGRYPGNVGTALLAAQAAIVNRNDEPNTPPGSSNLARHRDQPSIERSPSRSPASVDISSRPLIKKPSAITKDFQPKEPIEPESAQEQNSLAKPAPREDPSRVQTPPASGKGQESTLSSPVSVVDLHPGAELDGDAQPSHLHQSSSPGRSAHFPPQLAVVNFAGEQLHQPPPRSVSPAKSALKRNSSLSPDGRIHGILRPGPPLSELSDATSVASDDGARPSTRRKPFKVSFDDEAEVVGVAASPPTSPEDIIPESLPGKSKLKTSWLGRHKGKSSLLRSTDIVEFGGVLKPRAALPSFGSIRAAKDGTTPEIAPQPLSDDESTSSDDDQNLSFSNDHAIGNVISHAFSEDMQTQVPADNTLPVTTHTAARDDAKFQKERHPDDDSDSEAAFFQKTPLSPLQEVPSEQNLVVPDITLQPATPDLEKGRASLEEYEEPAEYPRSDEAESKAVRQKKGKRRSYGETDDESSESVYSDAEEGFEGDGFGSINAILDRESASEPELQPSALRGVAVTSGSKSETYEADQGAGVDGVPATCQIARAESPVLDDSKPLFSGPPEQVEPISVSSTYTEHPTQHEVTTATVQPGIARSSTMPVEVYSTVHFPEGKDSKGVDTRDKHTEDLPGVRQNWSQDKRRPELLRPPLRGESEGADRDELSANGANAYLPRRQPSNGSDSSSSFKRVRLAKRGGMGMRLTLRGNQTSNSAPSSPTGATAHTLNSRPLPPGWGAGTMRTTLRGGGPRKEKPSFFSTSKSRKGKPVRIAGTPFSSRFPDSDSDQEGPAPIRRLQRPARSVSDNDMRPVRGIPRRKGAYDGDSTELEDSSDGEVASFSGPRTPTRQAQQPQPTHVRDPALAAVAKSRGMTEEELEELLNRGSSGMRKPNILNRLSIRKSKPLVPRGKLQPHDVSTNGTVPEHSQSQIHEHERNDSPLANITASPSRLLKKARHKSSGDAWPVASENGDIVDSDLGSTPVASTAQQPPRPQTSDGVTVNGSKAVPAQHNFGASNEPQLLNEDRSFVNSGGNRVSDVMIEASGRKKRFQRLRKAFGIRA
ncbi:uncharacterized protein BJX67DRAFT_43142 [Aspergillus lucknowensis]|uniref:Uncharacterized protein n=1 Tax=Aspergillus lucknowensis TaxID=176173 RepID=A0ABR4LVK9_9EURO